VGKVYIERRELARGASLSWDIAHHLYTRQLDGVVLVVTDRPVVLLASVRKQWMKILQRLERERASTLDSRRVTELERQIKRMYALVFTVRPLKPADEGILFISPASINELNVPCSTAYLIYAENSVRDIVTPMVKRHGLLVVY
jgi:hypothetical protein